LFIKLLEKRLQARGHALIVVAEGAGQDLMGERNQEQEASGNGTTSSRTFRSRWLRRNAKPFARRARCG